MLDFEKLKFYNPTVGSLKFKDVIEEIFNYMKESPERSYEIVVGCDSSSNVRPSFPVALVVLRKGQGGRFFLAKIKYAKTQKQFHSFRQRVLEEIYLSCELALSFKEAFRQRLANIRSPLNYQFQYIHADVGTGGPTRDMIKEVVGLIKSNGFEAKIKPESFAASIVADRFT